MLLYGWIGWRASLLDLPLPLASVTDPEQRLARLSFSMSVRALHLLADDRNQDPALGTAPITLFVSHAKKDLDKQDQQDPVRWTQGALQELPVREWFDAREIREGADFESEIRNGLRRADAMLVFLTDAWASRPWCRTEALIAKEVGTPIVVVDALTEGEPRSFPYGGNTRLLLRTSPPAWKPLARCLHTSSPYSDEAGTPGRRFPARTVTGAAGVPATVVNGSVKRA